MWERSTCTWCRHLVLPLFLTDVLVSCILLVHYPAIQRLTNLLQVKTRKTTYNCPICKNSPNYPVTFLRGVGRLKPCLGRAASPQIQGPPLISAHHTKSRQALYFEARKTSNIAGYLQIPLPLARRAEYSCSRILPRHHAYFRCPGPTRSLAPIVTYRVESCQDLPFTWTR